MNQFDKTQIIIFEKNIESIKVALRSYQEILEKGEAFNMDVFDVEFKIKSEDGIRRLQVGDTKNQELLKHAFRKDIDGDIDDSLIKDDSEIYISEEIFFAIALEYSALTQAIVSTAKAMVSNMRKLNNTDSVWVDDMRIFAVGSIYMLAKKHPEYSYLLAQFFIPYWDLEHATGYEYCLYDLLKKHGWSKHMIKAFIWCDNAHFRKHMYAVDRWDDAEELQSLAQFLKSNTSEYAAFKQAIIYRFKQEPALLYSSQEKIENQRPVLEIFKSLSTESSQEYDDENEGEEYLQATFIYDSLENEAMDLHKLLLEQVKTPLTCHSENNLIQIANEKAYDKYLEKEVYKGDGTKALKEFILALTNGSKLWNYIETGENAQYLDKLKAEKIIPLAKQHATEFHECLNFHLDFCDDEDEINSQLMYILSNVIFDLDIQADDDEEETDLGNGFVSHVSIKSEDCVKEQINKNEQFLRILDIFYKLLGTDELSEYVLDTIANQEDKPLLSEEEFFNRYSKRDTSAIKESNQAKLIQEAKNSLTYYIGGSRDELERFSFNQIDKALSIERNMYDCTQWKDKNINTYCLAAYMLTKDKNQNIHDELTQHLLNYLEKGPWLLAFNELTESINKDTITNKELALIKDYFTAQQTTESNHESILELLKQHLYREECHRGSNIFDQFSKNQPGYALFRYSDSYQRVVLLSYWMQDMMPPLCFQAKRIWKLLVALAPQRVIRLISKTVSNEHFVAEFDSMQESDKFYEELERAKIPTEHIYAFQMVQSQNRASITEPCNLREYLSWLDLYDDIDSQESGMFGAVRKNRAIAFEKGLHYINEASRIQFYHDLSVRNTRFPFSQDAYFERALKSFLQLNAIERELGIDDLLSNLLSYLNGNYSYTDILKLFKKKIIKSGMSTGYESSGMSYLGQFFWLLETDKQNRMMKLLISHSSEGFEVLEHGLCIAYRDKLIKNGEMTLEYRLMNSLEKYDDEATETVLNAYAMLFDRLTELDILMERIVDFGLNQFSPVFNDYILKLARSGSLVAYIKKTKVNKRESLVQLFAKQDDMIQLLEPFVKDKSRKIRDCVEKLLK